MKFPKYPYEPCDRPESNTVDLQVGTSLARDTAWIKLPEDIRPYPAFEQELADAEADYRGDVWGPGEEKE